MPYEHEFSCRLKDPKKFKDPWARVKRKSKSYGKTYSVIRGTSKATNKFEDQAYRYSKKTWDASEARSHCKAHKGSYEAATEIQRMDALVEKSELEAAKGKYNCECIKCGYKMSSDTHCDKLECPECGGQMRRVERPGPGKGLDGEVEGDSVLLTRFATRIVNTPLMITPDKLNVILNVVGGRIGLDMKDNGVELSVASRLEKKEESGIAIVPVYDTLVYRSRGISALSGLSTYEQIGKDFRAALDDPKVEQIVLDIDSPGGEVSGVFDLVDEIYNARGTKPIIAAVNDIAYSAAYAIASAADKIYVPRVGGTGSIGVIAVHTDQSKYNEKVGVKFTSIFAGAKKDDFSPHKEISEEAVMDVQAKVDEVYSLFIDTVARNRSIPVGDVRNTEAATYLGSEGINAGLADEVLSWDQVIETLSSNSIGGVIMPGKVEGLKEKLDALFKDVSPDERDEVLSQSGYVPESGVEALKTETKDLRTEIDTLRKQSKDDIRKEMTDEYRAEVRKEVEAELSKSNGSKELQDRVVQLEKDVADAKKETATEKDGRRKLELENEVRDIGVIGDLEKEVEIILALEKTNPDMAKAHIEQLKKTSETLEAAGIFEELGAAGEGKAGGAYLKLKVIVDKLIEGSMEKTKAWRKAANDNPELYSEYRKTEGGK